MQSTISPAAYDAFMRDVVKAARARVSAKKMSARTWEFRGQNLAAQDNHDRELVLVGAAGTGKTLANLVYINRHMWNYPRLRVLIIRKVRADLAESALVTYERDVLGYDNPICAGARRDTRHAYHYPNGSIMVIAGIDRPGKVLSSEWDIVYAPECNQLELNDWEMLSMRLSRTGTYPYPQMRGDTNPDRPDHWILGRRDDQRLTLWTTYHRDNPAYHDGTDWTPLGNAYMTGLQGLTGVRRARYLEGRWVMAEGAIYDMWDDAQHVIDRFDIPADWPRYRAVDFGYTNPFVCQWWAADPDGRLYLYRELYRTQTLVEDHAARIKELSAGETFQFTVADHDAEDRATLARHGITTIAAKKQVQAGIQAVAERLRPAGDGKPRLFVFRDALVARDPLLEDGKRPVSTRHEVGGYVWNDKVKKEEPVKADDHGLDAMRYMVMAANRAPVKQSKNPFYGHG
jgi:PBSX family phage terminase large subunit